MMNYQKYYPVPSTYPPHSLSIPAHDPRFTPSFHPAAPTPAPAAPSVAAAVAARAPPPQPPAPPPGLPSGSAAPSYSHRPLRPSHEHFEQPHREMPRTDPSSAAYSYPRPEGTPASTTYPGDHGYASGRRGDNVYHVSQANHGSRKRAHRDEGFQGGSPVEFKLNHRPRGERERQIGEFDISSVLVCLYSSPCHLPHNRKPHGSQ